MNVTTVGIDLAKNVLQVHGVDARGKAILRRQLRRDQVTVFFARLQPCVIGMEACASAHHWARSLARFGHTVRPSTATSLMTAKRTSHPPCPLIGKLQLPHHRLKARLLAQGVEQAVYFDV